MEFNSSLFWAMVLHQINIRDKRLDKIDYNGLNIINQFRYLNSIA